MLQQVAAAFEDSKSRALSADLLIRDEIQDILRVPCEKGVGTDQSPTTSQKQKPELAALTATDSAKRSSLPSPVYLRL